MVSPLNAQKLWWCAVCAMLRPKMKEGEDKLNPSDNTKLVSIRKQGGEETIVGNQTSYGSVHVFHIIMNQLW